MTAGSPEARLSFLLHRANAGLSRISNPLFRQYGLDAITARILVIVLSRERTVVGDVVTALALPQSTVSHQVKRLEHAGFLRRVQDATDNRSFHVVLTREGRKVAQECDRRSRLLNQVMTDHLSTQVGLQIFDDLGHLIDLLESLDPEDLVE